MSDNPVIVENLNNLDNESLNEKLQSYEAEIRKASLDITELQDQLRAYRREQSRVKRILHERSLTIDRWCKFVDSYEGRCVLYNKVKQRIFARDFWVYMLEKLEHGYCKVIVICKCFLYARSKVDIESLDDKTIQAIDIKNEYIYYATPAVIDATLLIDASLEVAMQDGYLFDLVHQKIPEFKTGLAGYVYKENKWYRIRSRYERSNGIPTFIRTRD